VAYLDDDEQEECLCAGFVDAEAPVHKDLKGARPAKSVKARSSGGK